MEEHTIRRNLKEATGGNKISASEEVRNLPGVIEAMDLDGGPADGATGVTQIMVPRDPKMAVLSETSTVGQESNKCSRDFNAPPCGYIRVHGSI